jgi:PPM family protein phosphatase
MILPLCRSASATLQGRRPVNQDATAALALADGRYLVAVADGMGGHQAGEVASAMALEVLTRELSGGAGLRDAVVAANSAVYEHARENSAFSGMGTTMVAVLLDGGTYQVANVGDSRAYRVDLDGILQVTRDHSFASEAVQQKLMSSDEVARSPWRNALTRSLGTEASVEVDIFGPYEIAGPPHLVVLCSDGLYRAVGSDALWEALVTADDGDTAARTLSSLAYQNRSDDNISVALLECGDWFRTRAPRRVTDRRPSAEAVVAPAGPLSADSLRWAIPRSPDVAPVASGLLLAPSRNRRGRRHSGRQWADSLLFALSVALLGAWLVWQFFR